VHTGLVGVTYDEGALKILTHGRHMIDSATHVFHRFLSTQQKSLRLASVTASEKALRATGSDKKSFSQSRKNADKSKSTDAVLDLDSDLTICETKDLVKVGLRADVFYSIEDPEKCINKIDTDELEDLVRETAVATLTNIIRSTALNEISQSKQVSAGGIAGGLTVLPSAPGESGEQGPAPSMSAFFEKAHDDFLDKLHDDFMFRYGVDIANIRIESFKIMDTELSDQISKHALTTAQIENEMANLEGNSLISTTRERTAAAVKSINATAEAQSLKVTTDAENERKIQAAQAEAESLKIQARAKAEAEAESILTKAKAEAEAIRLKAAAEAERAALLSKTNLGMQEALLRIYSDIVIESNRGVEKVIYMDPSVNRESPFAIGSLQNLNNDLHSLTHLGIAAGEAGGNGNGRKKASS
jgi:regulator of protease activity HflC (stomatin/prohibitin superfamily)